MQLKYSNYVAFSHVHGVAVNNSGKSMLDFVTLLNETLENVIIRTSFNGMWFTTWEDR